MRGQGAHTLTLMAGDNPETAHRSVHPSLKEKKEDQRSEDGTDLEKERIKNRR